MAPELDKKQIKRRAKEILKTGISKQETYEQLSEEFQNRTVTANILKRLPSSKALKKYGVWNHLLLGLYIIVALMLYLVNPSPGIILWYGLLILTIARKATKYYFWVTIMSGFMVITMLYFLITSEVNSEYLARSIFFLCIIIPTCILPTWLSKNLTPAPDEKREFYTNENGEQRSRTNVVFNE